MRIYIPSKMVRNAVVVGFLLAFSAVTMVSYLAYDSVNDLVTSLRKVTQPKQNQITLKEIYAELVKAESSVRTFTITQNTNDLSPFYLSIINIGGMDSALNIPNQTHMMDSIQGLIVDKFLSMKRLIYAADETKVKRIFDQLADKIMEAAEEGELEPTIFMDEDRIKALEDSLGKRQNKHVKSKKSYKRKNQKEIYRGELFEKIFGNNGKSNSRRTIVDSVLDDALPDTDTLSGLRDMLYDIQDNTIIDTFSIDTFLNKNYYLSQRVALIRRLTREDQLNMSKLQRLIRKIEYNERVSSEYEVDIANAKAERTIRFMGIVSLIGLTLFILLVVILFRDISRHQRLQIKLRNEKARVEKLARAKEEFLANISHEIRTPMNAIVGFTEQFYETSLTPTQLRFLENISHSAEHLMALINDVLDYSKLESGNFKLEQTGFRPSNIIKEVYITFQHAASEKGIEWNCHQESVLPDILIGDPLRLKQMLFNLVSNAIKFTDYGQVNLICKAEILSKSEVILYFMVEDTGVGIPEDKLDHIFKDFSQADSSTTRKYGGTGLGLAITRRLAEMHKGSIHLKSMIGYGTTVSLQLKYQMGTSDDLDYNDVREINPKALFDGMRTLVADDALYNLELIKAILLKWGVKVELVDNGKDAVEKVRDNTYDFVLMDLQMPELDGLEAVVQIRETLKSNVPIIALTATSTPSEISKCLEKGMQACLLKPFKEKDLAETLADVLNIPMNERKEHPNMKVISNSKDGIRAKNQIKDPYGNVENGSSTHNSYSSLENGINNDYSLEELYELADHNIPFLINMLNIFISNTPKNMDLLKKALEEEDWDGMRNMAHKIVPPCRHLHLTEIVKQLKEIEFQAKTKQNLEGMVDKVKNVVLELNHIIEKLRLEVEKLQSPEN